MGIGRIDRLVIHDLEHNHEAAYGTSAFDQAEILCGEGGGFREL